VVATRYPILLGAFVHPTALCKQNAVCEVTTGQCVHDRLVGGTAGCAP